MAERLGDTISVDDSMRLAEATVKLWDMHGNNCQGTYFRLTPNDFGAWKTEHDLARILGQDIPQDATGLQRFTRYWEEKVPQMNRCQRRIHGVIEDPEDQRGYRDNVRGRWYRHILEVDCPPDGADREWVDLINQVNHSWRKAADFMIGKRNAGLTMIEEEDTFVQSSTAANTLVGDMYTEVISYQEAIQSARELTGIGSRWVRAANNYYEMTPSDITRQGLSELIGDMNLQRDWDYAQTKADITAGENRACLIYRPDAGITIRTFDHLREIDRSNLAIFKEIFQNKPREVLAAPVVPLPVPAVVREPEPDIAPDGLIRENEETRKKQAFIGKFQAVVKNCDGKIALMSAGNVEHWLDQVKELSNLYDKLFNELHDYEAINFIDVTFPPTPGSDLPVTRQYASQSELLNWSTQLRNRKIECQEARTQANDARRLEIREKGDLLKQENILTKLQGERNYLFWADGLQKISEIMPKGTSKYKIAMIVRGSIANEQDQKNTQSMTDIADILAYMEQKYMNSPNLLSATLTELKDRKMPRNYQQAADNIAATISMGRLLENVGILVQVELGQLAMLESKCILAGTRKELYNQKQIENLMAEEAPEAPRSSTPILGASMREEAADSPMDGSMALAQMSMSLARAQSGADSGKRRNFFFKYLHGEAKALRYAIAQDMLTGVQSSSMNMYGTREQEGDRRPPSGRFGGGYGASKVAGKGPVPRDHFNRPLLACPLQCNHKVPYGSATFCANFHKDTKQVRKDKVAKYMMCKKCLKKNNSHTLAECKARACTICGGEHSHLLCDHEGGQQKMFATTEEGGNGGDGSGRDNDQDDDKGGDDTERMHQQEEIEANLAYEDPRDDELVEEERLWTLFEEEEETQELDKLEAEYAISFWAMIEKQGLIKNGSEVIRESEKIDALMAQKRSSAEMAATRSGLDIGPESKKRKESVEAETISGEVLSDQPSGKVSDDSEIIARNSTDGVSAEEAAVGKFPMETGKSDTNGESEGSKPVEGIIARNSKRELTWMEVLTAAVPQKITDWAQTIMTLMRPWSESDNLKWKLIRAEAENPQNEKYFSLEDQMAKVQLPEESMMHITTTDSTKVAEPPPSTFKKLHQKPLPGHILAQSYNSPQADPNYIAVGPKSLEREIYRTMVKQAVDLNKQFKGVKGMMSKIKICVNLNGATPTDLQMADVEYGKFQDRDVICVNALFDGGADGGGFDEDIIDMVDKLESKTIAVGTAIGVDTKEYNRAKLKLVGNRFQSEQVFNMSAIGLGRIGVNKNNTQRYLDKLSELFGFNEDFKKHFAAQISKNPEKVYAVIGQRFSSALLVNVTAEQMGTHHPWILPNIRIYYNPLTHSMLMAGHMGIEEELIDEDYPVFLVHKTTWKKMKQAFHQDKAYNIMSITEARDETDEKEYNPTEVMNMMNQDETSVTHLTQEMQSVALEEEENELTENRNHTIQEELDTEDIQRMMYENETTWNMEEICKWDDEYTIQLTKEEQSPIYVDEAEQEANMLTNQECDTLGRFLQQEAAEKPKVFCETCSQRQCINCDNLRNRYSEEEQETYRKMWNNVKLEDIGGQKRVRATYIYRNDPKVTFAPENSNMKTAIGRTNEIINKLIKNDQLEEFQEEIEKKIKIGCLEEVPEAEVDALLKRTHHFCYLQIVFSENSESTSTRMINNTLTSTPQGTSFSIENKVPVSDIGDSYESLLNFLLYIHGYSSDVSKCYLRVLVDKLTSELRLMVWYKDPKNKTGLKIYRRKTMDFGDACAALVVRIVQKKFLVPMAKFEATQHTISSGGYADNYSDSFETIQEYKAVSEDMERIHKEIGLPLKGTYTDIETDPEILKKLGKEDEENPSYTFLGITWDLKKNEVRPNTYFNLNKKLKGQSGEKKLMEMEGDDFQTEPFLGGLTRRILSRLAAQCYDRLGLFLGPITTGLKILVSRSTELCTASQLDKPIQKVDTEFVNTCSKFLKDLPNLKKLKPHPKALIPKGNKLKGIYTMRDGGIPAYSTIAYLGSTNQQNQMTTNVCATKGRVSKRTIPAHEALSGALQAEETKKIATVLSHRPGMVQQELEIIMAGDSICVATLFNPRVVMKNILLKTSVLAVKQKCRDIIKIFPKATIKICWMDGKLNAADSTSKLMFDNVDIMNSNLYRHGPGNLHQESEDRVVFYKFTIQGEQFFPLPERLIMRAKEDTEKIQKSDPSETFANNQPEEECELCHQTEDCGLMITRRMNRLGQTEEQKTKEIEKDRPKKRKLKSQSCDGMGFSCKIRKIQTLLRDKDVLSIGSKITDAAHEKEKIILHRSRIAIQERNSATNLFDTNREYIMPDIPMNQKLYERVLRKRSRVHGGLHYLTHIIKIRCAMKKIPINLLEARKEAWRMMLIKSQANMEPQALKSTTTKMIHKVKVAVFRISEDNMNTLFGTPVLPLLNPREELARKLIHQAHTTKKYEYHPIHRTLESAKTALCSGSYGVWIKGASQYLQALSFTCTTCNAWRNWSYTPALGDKYVRLNNSIGPFKEISIDPLGPITVKPFPGSRKTVKAFPLLLKCINSAAVELMLMESMETKSLILCLLRLELRYGKLMGIAKDSGTNMLTENINPKTEDETRIFEVIKEYTAPVDSQFRNYSERSTGLIKKYLKQACGVEKTETLPVMLRSEMQLLCDLACGMVNKIPYGKSKEMIMICPADTLLFGPKEDYVPPPTKSKLSSINLMIENIRIHKAEMVKIRDDHLSQELAAARIQVKKMGRVAEEIKPTVGDLVLVRNTGKADYDKYGVIEKVLSPQTLQIRTRNGIIERPSSITIPISPQCLLMENPNKKT